MEVVGGLAAILQLIGATAAALTYIDNVKGSVQERQALARETSTLRSLLTELDSRVRNHPTPSSFLQTALEDPARQLNVALKELNQLTSAPTPISAASSPRRSIRDLAWKMRWPTKKKTATELLRSVERAKIYISLVLQQEIW
ncbi:hypothetical protein B0T14DRAFT_499985 [Immersiella caudata]|uniref:Fungal N-terminal domain-containing protein n=1 Tax=Immersiella caudata TaxID=314043 RepID=A0AA39WCP3_9PEZI|nr:hypothetical protein B0T14DRAFT_499985 [Immersiella caudata]